MRRHRSVCALVVLVLLAGMTSALVHAVTWSDHEVRLTTNTAFDGLPALLETSDKALWLFWTKTTMRGYEIFYMTSDDEGATWSTETQLTASWGANTGVSAIQAQDGKIWVAWASNRTGDYEIFYKTSADLGASWSGDTPLTVHPGRDLKPAIYQVANGTVWVIWGSDRTGNYDLFLRTSSDGGSTWSGAVQLTTDPEADKMPSILQTADGRVWVVWASTRTTNGDVYRKTYDGSAWSEETPLTSSPPIASNPTMLQTIDGKIWIFYSSRSQSENGTDDLYYLQSTDNGATWSSEIQFTTDPYDDMWPSTVQSTFTRVWVVWTSDRFEQPDWGNWDIYYRTSIVGDLNEDGVVDILDLSIVGLAYGHRLGQPNYNPDADLNVDGIVDSRDLALVTRNFGAT